MLNRYHHLQLETGELGVPSSLNGLLDWLIVGARTGAPLFTAPSGDIATPGVTELRTRIASLQQQLQAGKERLKTRESELLGRLSAAKEQAQTAFISTEASLKRQSALNKEVASLRNQLSASFSAPSVDVESKLASVREKLAAANDTFCKLCAKVKTIGARWTIDGDELATSILLISIGG